MKKMHIIELKIYLLKENNYFINAKDKRNKTKYTPLIVNYKFNVLEKDSGKRSKIEKGGGSVFEPESAFEQSILNNYNINARLGFYFLIH